MTRSRWIAPALWAVLIELLTSWPSPPTFGAPSGSDKVGHFALFAVFAYLVLRATNVGKPTPKSMILTMIVLSVWAALDEAHQLFIVGRTASVGDWVADVVGVGLGAAARLARPANVQPTRT